MSLSQYIKIKAARVQHVLLAAAPVAESEKCPCPACKGEGVLGTYTEFAAVRKDTSRLADANGNPIVCVDMIPCPSCAGTGLNREQFLKEVV